MKVILSILLSVGLVLCEVPPPYPPRGFRPSPPFNLPIRQPQTSYGVPASVPSKISQPAPQIQYGVPNQQGTSSSPNLTPNFNSKQTIPSTSYGVPVTSSPYRTIISESQADSSVSNQGITPVSNLAPNFNLKQTNPSTSSRAPITNSPYRTIVSEPQISYGTPSNQQRPSTQYGVPDAKNVETLEQIRQLNLLLQLSQSSKANQQRQNEINFAQSQNSNRNVGVPSQQYLPTKEATEFRSNSQSQISQQNIGQPSQGYLPAQGPTNLRNGFNVQQSNNQEPFEANPNLQKLSQQYLPVKEASNFEKGVEFPQPVVPERQNVQPNVNYGQPLNNPQQFNTAGSFQNNQQDLPRINPNLALAPQSPNTQISSYEAPLLSNGDIQQANVRRLQNSNRVVPQRQNVQPNVNYDQPLNNPQLFNTAGSFQNNLQDLPRINPNLALEPQNPNTQISSYEAPLLSNGDIQQANVRRLQNSNRVQTPIRQNRVQPVQQNRDFADSNIQGASREQIDEKYLPPTTTARTIHQPVSGPAPLPNDSSDEDEQSTESKEEAGGPNIAVATAVSGVPGGQSFYLLQPDGRLQRVIYQKTRAEGDRENEYTANYLFQNIQADPSLVYSPLVALGKR